MRLCPKDTEFAVTMALPFLCAILKAGSGTVLGTRMKVLQDGSEVSAPCVLLF